MHMLMHTRPLPRSAQCIMTGRSIALLLQYSTSTAGAWAAVPKAAVCLQGPLPKESRSRASSQGARRPQAPYRKERREGTGDR